MKARVIQLLGVVGFCMLLTLHAPMAIADTFNVSNGIELWDALQEAAANDADDVINLAAGTYDQYVPDPFLQFANFVCNPVESEPRSLTIQGAPGTSADQVILDGHDNGFVLSIFDGTPADAPTPAVLPEINIIGLTLHNGNAPYEPGGLRIHSYFHHVTVRNCRITNNISEDGRGGGARIFTRLGELTFENNLVMGNRLFEREVTSACGTSDECQGAGVHIKHQGETATIQNNIFANNIAEGDNGVGGGLYLGGWQCGASWRIWNLVNNTIVDNSARHGGGLFTNLRGELNLYNNIIYANVSPAADPDPTDFWVAEQCSSDQVFAYHNNFSNYTAVIDESVDNLNVDPAFIGFYNLPAGSTLIDAGTDRVPSGLPGTDYEGDSRICLLLPDIGADERCVSAKQLYPAILRKGRPVPSVKRQHSAPTARGGIQVSLDLRTQ